jgi:hypothetical protein
MSSYKIYWVKKQRPQWTNINNNNNNYNNNKNETRLVQIGKGRAQQAVCAYVRMEIDISLAIRRRMKEQTTLDNMKYLAHYFCNRFSIPIPLLA